MPQKKKNQNKRLKQERNKMPLDSLTPNPNILPIFKTSASIGRSLITVDDCCPDNPDLEIRDNEPVSIFAIAKHHKLSRLVVVDDSFLNFPNLYKLSNKYNIHLVFGVNLTVCNDSSQKDEESLSSNSRVSILMNNSKGYRDLIRLYNYVCTNKETFYYTPRCSYNDLIARLTDNLTLLVGPHNSFLEKNLIYNGTCIPFWSKVKPTMCIAEQGLPYSEILNKKITEYAENNGFKLIKGHSIYYYKNSDFKAYTLLRCINNRTDFKSPDINYLTSDQFSFEACCV